MGGGDDFTVHSTQHCRHPTRPSILSVTVFSEHRHHDLSLSEIRLILMSKDDPDGEVQVAAACTRAGRTARAERAPGSERARSMAAGRLHRSRRPRAQPVGRQRGVPLSKSEGDASTRSGGRSPGRHNPYGRLFSDFAKNLENPNLELIHTSHYTVGIRTGMTLRLQCGPHCDTHTYSFIARPIPAPSPPPAVRSRLYGMSAAVAVSATL